jgi:hypothetical protein
MANPIKSYLKSHHTASRSQSDKKAALERLNESLGTGLSSNEMFEKIHENLVGLFEDYAIFDKKYYNINLISRTHNWIAVAQHIESCIINKNFAKDSVESPLRRGLIQVYLYYFASYYLSRPEYSFKYIQGNFMNLKNLNRLQSDRDLLFSELLARMKAANNTLQPMHTKDAAIIPRKNFVDDLCKRLKVQPYLMLIGPQGMGKSVTLNLIADHLRSSWQIKTYQFSSRDQISHPDFFFDQMLSFFDFETHSNGQRCACLYLLDDLHLLPPTLHKVLRDRVFFRAFSLGEQQENKLAIIATSAFPLEILTAFQMGSPQFMPYHLEGLEKQDIEELWEKSPVKTSHLPDQIYRFTRGYPALVGQMITSGVSFDNSQWFNAIFNAVNWDETVTELMKALCTFRYIGPFFMNDLAKFTNDPYQLQEIWHIPETILDTTKAHLMWEKLIHRNAFIQRISQDYKEFPLDKNFVIARNLRQLAENAVRVDQPAIFELRHKLASEYYYSQISNPLIPGNKKPLLTIEYLYHLTKQGLSSKQIFSIANHLIKLADSTERPVDIHKYGLNFLKYFNEDIELQEVMGEDLSKEIINQAQREDIT